MRLRNPLAKHFPSLRHYLLQGKYNYHYLRPTIRYYNDCNSKPLIHLRNASITASSTYVGDMRATMIYCPIKAICGVDNNLFSNCA